MNTLLFQCKGISLFWDFGIKKFQVTTYKKEGSMILLRLWRCKFLLQKNIYSAKLLGFVSWVVLLGFFT